MIDISLDDLTSEDINALLYLREMGIPDEMIQQAYENTMRKRKEENIHD